MIKKLLAIAAVAMAGLLSAPQAEAGHSGLNTTYRSGQSSCGCPIYTKRFVRGYDCRRQPIFGYSRVPISHGSSCRHNVRHRGNSHRPVIQRSSHRGHNHSPRIVISSRSYPSRGYSRRGSSFSFSIGGSSCR